MGKIDVRFDDKSELLIKNEAARLHMNISDYIRYKVDPTKSTSSEQIIQSFINEMKCQKVELVEMRKELRIAIGAMIETLKPFNVTVEEMKQSGIDFYKAGEKG